MKKVIFRKEKDKQKTICIVGVSPKIGVTHIALTIANFIASALREKVIYISYSDSRELVCLLGAGGYKYKNIEFILENEIKKIISILVNEKAWIIVDLGTLNQETSPIFNQCKKKIILGSLMPWCRREYLEYMRTKIVGFYDLKTIDFYCRNSSKEGIKVFADIFKEKVSAVPTIDDPFSLEEKNFESIMKLIL